MNELVTGDAVVLGLRPAKLPSRALALAIDMAVVWTVYLIVSIGLALATGSLDEAAGMALAVASFLLVLVGAPIAVETLTQGRSLGKLACGLRVVRDDGGPIRFRHALVRGAVGVVEILMTFGVVACIASLVSERGRRIGDVFAGTLVVRERVATGRMAAVPPPPPWLLGRFAGLDLSGVPDSLWLAVRQYLTRMRQLDPQVSWSMAERLAGDLAARTGAPVPEGVPPAAYLAAVVNERQYRDARKAFVAAGAARAADVGPGGGPGTRGGAGVIGAAATPDRSAIPVAPGRPVRSGAFAPPDAAAVSGPAEEYGVGSSPDAGMKSDAGAGAELGPGAGAELGPVGVGPGRAGEVPGGGAPHAGARHAESQAPPATGFAPPA
ncbi:RDD family protein [Streptomyces sp. H27-C3]|uniref:RDD family protein n=1 Tax=Streptomyces sp. H27-C3 TaxID=3046305 RepID=UPI0024BB3176|nr:RDD family protein [Streptomyces sp. H27-C3]MDJ0460336.1 RDD family protein [Streptomyces sp. H27-C3]